MEWLEDNRVKIAPPKKPHKISGTRFAAVLGYNVWKSEFATWCEMTDTYKEPFIDNKYTIAGKTIEPIIDEYLRKSYYMTNLYKPEDIYLSSDEEMQKRDFFLDREIFGGMWDAVLLNDDNTVDTVIEIKTSSRPEDWEKDIPIHYALQASLYAYLLNVEKVIIVCSFLKDQEYDNPGAFVPTAKNTIVRSFKVLDKFPNFNLLIEKAKLWYKDHVLTGISPQYLPEDEDVLKALKTKYVDPDADIEELMDEYIALTYSVDAAIVEISSSQKRLKALQERIKEYSIQQFKPNENNVVMTLKGFTFNTGLSYKKEIDKDKLKEDGLLDAYTITKPVYTLRVSKNKEVK